MTTLEELKRKEKSVTRLFRLFMVIMTLIVVLLAAWIIAYIDLP